MNNIYRQGLATLTLGGFLWCFAPQAQAQVVPLLEQIRDATQTTANYLDTILTDLQSTGKQVLDAITAPTPLIDDTTKGNTQIGSAVTKAKSDYQMPLTSKAMTTLLSTTANDQPTLLSEITSLSGPDFPTYKSYKIAPSISMNLPNNSEHSPFSIESLLGAVSFADG